MWYKFESTGRGGGGGGGRGEVEENLKQCVNYQLKDFSVFVNN